MVIAFYSNGMQCSRDKPLLFTSILRTSRIQVKLIFIHCRLKSSSYFQRYPSNRGIPTLTVPYTPCVSLAHFSTLFHSAQYTHTHTHARRYSRSCFVASRCICVRPFSPYKHDTLSHLFTIKEIAKEEKNNIIIKLKMILFEDDKMIAAKGQYIRRSET